MENKWRTSQVTEKRMLESRETEQSHSYKTKDPSSYSVDACLSNVSEYVLFSQNSEGGIFYRQVLWTQTRTKKAYQSSKLHNKSPPNLPAYNSYYISFTVILQQFKEWVVWTQGSQEAVTKLQSGAIDISRLDWKRLCFHCSLLASLRRSFSKLSSVGLSSGLPPERQLASTKASESRQSKSTQDRNTSFYNPNSGAKIWRER